jgi:hypothetical protein
MRSNYLTFKGCFALVNLVSLHIKLKDKIIMEFKYFTPVRLIKVKKPLWLKLRDKLKKIKLMLINIW